MASVAAAAVVVAAAVSDPPSRFIVLDEIVHLLRGHEFRLKCD